MTPPSLLGKCEDFLLHPTVRVLSLAQRVDFLEKKGLSPEEITQCLKRVEQRNGLSQLARQARNLPLSRPVSSAATSSPLSLIKRVVKKYGAVTLLLMLLSFGYVQYRKRKTQQLEIANETHKLQRKKRMSGKVEQLLHVVKQQQMQYNQAAELLTARVDRYVAATQSVKQVDATMTQFMKSGELRQLQSELLELKEVVVNTYLRPKVVEKVVEVTRELPILLRPAEVTLTDKLAQTEMLAERVKGTTLAKTKKRRKEVKEVKNVVKRSAIQDQKTMSSAEITELYQSAEFDDELSTARSYRILFAT